MYSAGSFLKVAAEITVPLTVGGVLSPLLPWFASAATLYVLGALAQSSVRREMLTYAEGIKESRGSSFIKQLNPFLIKMGW